MQLYLAFLTVAAVQGAGIAPRKLEEYDAEEVDYSEIIYDYSVKYQGCFTSRNIITQDEALTIDTKTYVKFKLCEDCKDMTTTGCESGGDYVLDIATYVAAALEFQEQEHEIYCETLLRQYEFDYDAAQAYGTEAPEDIAWPSYCENYEGYEVDEENPYAQQQAEQLQEYMEGGCTKLENDNNGNDNGEEVEYYVGLACTDNGDKVGLGLFTDEECTTETDSSVFYTIMGYNLNSDTNIVSDYCTSCLPTEEWNSQDNEEDEDAEEEEKEVNEFCKSVYESSWKCEEEILSGTTTMCAWIQAVAMSTTEGQGISGSSDGNASGMVTLASTVFTLTAVGLAGYTYYLRSKVIKANSIDLGN
jgi:hypothetical protein